MDRDPGLQRVYFDLASQAVVEPEVGGIMIEMKQGHRAILRELLRGLELGIPRGRARRDRVYLDRRVSRGSRSSASTAATARRCSRAREIFIESATAAIERHRAQAPGAPVISLLRKAFALRPPPALRLRLLRWMAGSAVREFAWALLAATILVDRGPGRARAPPDSTARGRLPDRARGRRRSRSPGSPGRA